MVGVSVGVASEGVLVGGLDVTGRDGKVEDGARRRKGSGMGIVVHRFFLGRALVFVLGRVGVDGEDI